MTAQHPVDAVWAREHDAAIRLYDTLAQNRDRLADPLHAAEENGEDRRRVLKRAREAVAANVAYLAVMDENTTAPALPNSATLEA